MSSPIRFSLVIIMTILLVLPSAGQTIEDIIEELEQLEPGIDSAQVDHFHQLTKDYYKRSPVEYNLGKLAMTWGLFFAQNFESDSAITSFQLSKRYYEEAGDSANLALAYYKLGTQYTDIEDYITSTEMLHEGLKLYTILGNREFIAKSLNSIGNNYYYSGGSDIALGYYGKAVKIYSDMEDVNGETMVLGNMAAMYSELKQYDSALAIYNRSLVKIESSDLHQRKMDQYIGIGIVKESLGELDEAFDYYKRSYQLAITLNNQVSIGYGYQNFAYYFLAIEAYDSARYYAEKTLEFSNKLDNYIMRSNAQEVLHETYFKLGMVRKAYETLRILRTEEDSVFNIKSASQLNEMHARLDSEKKEIEIRLKNKELAQATIIMEQERTLRNALIGGVFLMFIVILLVVRASKIQKRANALLRVKNSEIESKTKEIQSIEVARSKWFLNISHDLRTPLTLVKGPLSELTKSQNLTSYEGEIVNIADRNIQVIENLVNEILDLSKFEEGRATLQQTPTDISKLARETTELFRAVAQTGKFDLKFEYMLGNPIVLDIDKPKIQKVLLNLISNAIKYSPDGGKVVVRLAENADHIVISVIDQGIGIARQDMGKVFKRFYQAHDQSVKQGGLGIGLAMSREIVLMHEGDLLVESVRGEGSTFEILLPSTLKVESHPPEEPTQPATKRAPQTEISERGKHILIVDDNSDMRTFIMHFLSGEFRISQARDGYEALSRLESDPPDLIISDIMMPKMDGFTFARRVKENPQWTGIPFIVLTAVADEDERLKTLRIGIDDYLYKPFNPEELVIRIHNLLKNQVERVRVQFERNGQVEPNHTKLMTRLQREVSEHLDDPDLNVTRLADMVAISERQLYRYIKQNTGLTPATFVREIRLQRAFELARKQTYQTTAELSYAVGFQHPSYFTTIFRKRFGKNPSELLKDDFFG